MFDAQQMTFPWHAQIQAMSKTPGFSAGSRLFVSCLTENLHGLKFCVSSVFHLWLNVPRENRRHHSRAVCFDIGKPGNLANRVTVE
jgi:hypothetical protein